MLVDIPAQGAAPQVTPIPTGQFHWRMCDESVTDTDGLADLGARLRAMPERSSTILRLSLKGALPLSGRTELERLKGSLDAALFHLDLQKVDLVSRPTLADLETIDFGGVLREAAETLQAMADDPARAAQERHRAEDALVQLYLMSTAAASDGVKEA